MLTWMKNQITDLYNAVLALSERLQSVRDTASLLNNRTMHHIGYGKEALKDIVENAAKEEEKPLQQKKEGKRVKGCGLLPEWLRKKRCINALDTFDDNLCVWRCLALYKRKDMKRGAERSTKEALNLAREFYSDNKLKRKDVRATRLEDFEGIAKHFNVNIVLYESEKESGEDAGKIWRVVHGKTQYKDTLSTINMGLFKGHCFYINKIAVLCQRLQANL